MKNTGILLHISSLDSNESIGTLGKGAYDFVDYLEKSNQNMWQILPINPTSYKDSPYQSFSVFAGNPYFIDLEFLIQEHFLLKEEVQEFHFVYKETVDYQELFTKKIKLLKKAYFKKNLVNEEFIDFCSHNHWLNSYALFMSLKEYHNYCSWNMWEDKYKKRKKMAIDKFMNENDELIEMHKFIQFLFFKQWFSLKNYANSKNIQIIGDIPIYVAYDSVECWNNPSDFYFNKAYDPIEVAGCPPDAFSKTGQLWGNPIYNWKKMKKNNFSWWIYRIEQSLKLFDYVRIDHFRGFSGYYSIPFGDKTAENGKWNKNIGKDLFKLVNEHFDTPKIIAEDLGYIDQRVRKLLKSTGYPGMRVMQFEMYNEKEIKKFKKVKANTVVYTGTHDNANLVKWYNDLSICEKVILNKYAKIKENSKINLKLIEFCLKLEADFVIIPFQDWLGIENGRMNEPSTSENNWGYRIKKEDLNQQLSKTIKKMTIKNRN